MATKRILVTGGGGFIGSHLTRRLVAEGHQVVVIDNFSSGTKANLRDLVDHPRVQVLRHDVTLPLPPHVEVDEIYHLACPASPVFYQRDPVQTTKTAVLGSINVLDLARRTRAKVLLSSTSEVYGDPLVHPQPETYWGHVNPIGTRSCYDEGKRCAETLFFDYRRQHDLPVKVARLFNTYGPSMRPDDGRVISNFIVAALCGQPLSVHGDGQQTRSFCFVDDIVEGLVRFMDTPTQVTGPINLGNPREFTILQLAEAVTCLVGADTAIRFGPRPPDDPAQRRPDITLAREILGWHPVVELEAGLRATADYFRTAMERAQD